MVCLRYKLFFLIWFELSCFCLCASECIVPCQETTFIGTTSQTRGGKTICSYKGIRFAKPPVDHLRFKNPEYLELPEGNLHVTQDGQECFQRASFSLTDTTSYAGTEDCLYLNVYPCTQYEKNYVWKIKRLPVIVFIHGGGWVAGSNKQSFYGPEYLCDKEVVYVSVNYRLGFFGFMTSGDDQAPGNLGLKDMAVALRWVHDNIACFGGDPDKVTVAGESVGAISTVFLSVSPWSREYFRARLSFSGCERNPNAFRQPEEVAASTKQTAEFCGCSTNNTVEMVLCLQKCPAEIIMKAPVGNAEYPVGIIEYFRPILDLEVTNYPFLPDDPRTVCATKPWISGLNTYGGSYFMAHLAAYPDFLKMVLANPCDYIADLLVLRLNYQRDAIPTVTEQICQYYFQHKSTDRSKMLKLFTDAFFLIPGYVTALKYRRCGETHFFINRYHLQSRQTWNDVYGPPGVLDEYIPGHTDVLSLLFPTYALFDRSLETKLDVEISKTVIEYTYNFAKYGSPTQQDRPTPWDTIGTEKAFNYLSINTTIEQEQNPDHETVRFWRKLDELYGSLPERDCMCQE